MQPKITITYKVIPEFAGLGSTEFQTLIDAQAYVQNHLDGLPDHKEMTPENREYWASVGKTMTIHYVIELDHVLSNSTPTRAQNHHD